MPDESLVMKALDNFFKHIFPIPVFSFLHKPSIIQRYQSGLLDKALTLAIVGITSQLTDLGAGTRAYGDKCVAASESIVLRDVGRPSVIKIQCLILIIEHHLLRRDFTTAFTLHALACRFAFALRLNHEAPKLCFLAQESRRRLIWSLYTLDCYLSGGMTELTLCPAESLHIQLPCQERNFEFDLEQQTEPLPPRPHQPVSDNVGSLGLYLRILYLHEKVLRCTKEMVMTQAAEDSVEHFPRIVEALAGELDDYAASLPASFHFSEKNLHLRAYSPRLCPFVLIHIWWRQCYCDLFKFTIPGLRVALAPESLARLNPDFVAYCRWQCFENARALADAFRSLIALRRTLPIMDTQVHLSAYQCARLLYYCYRNHAATLSLTAEAVNDYARQCLEVLERLPHRTLTGDSIVSPSHSHSDSQ
jgi:Fungal specific transcription factor domain